MAEITAEMIDERRRAKQREYKKRWEQKNREYLRAYQKAWRDKYKQEHNGTSYETARLRKIAEAELRQEQGC